MTRKEKQAIEKWAKTLSDKELEEAYCKAVLDCLGSEAEEMYERGYDMRDIQEREKFEDYLSEKADVLEVICEQRGIKFWEENANAQAT